MMPLTLLLALAIDRWLGEPPSRWHPVVWMGRYLEWAGKQVQAVAAANGKAFWFGAFYWSAGALLCIGAAGCLQAGILQLSENLSALTHTHPTAGLFAVINAFVAAVLLALMLKPMFAWRMLCSEVQAVEAALAQSLQTGRARLAWLVSRDTTVLTAAQVRESAIESLAENLSDSVVAPIFWFVLLGLPGAVLYRFANTADAMWGYPGMYQGRNWQWAGKWAARADDLANWLPARLTGALIALVGGGAAMAELRCEAAKTASPNSGWPMAAVALSLAVRLGKPGAYVLNHAAHAPVALDTARAVDLAAKVLGAYVPIAVAALVLKAWVLA